MTIRFQNVSREGGDQLGEFLARKCGKSMRWQLWHNGLGGPVLAFWEGPMLMIKEDAFAFASDLGSPSQFHSQLSSLG